MIIDLKVDSYYQFKFKEPFTSLGYTDIDDAYWELELLDGILDADGNPIITNPSVNYQFSDKYKVTGSPDVDLNLEYILAKCTSMFKPSLDDTWANGTALLIYGESRWLLQKKTGEDSNHNPIFTTVYQSNETAYYPNNPSVTWYTLGITPTKVSIKVEASGKPATLIRDEAVANRASAIKELITAANKGVYQILQILTMSEMLDIGVANLTDLYVKCGSTAEKYNSDYTTFKLDTYPVLKLKNAQDETDIIYVSAFYLFAYPEVQLSQYAKLMLTVNLGTFDDPELYKGVATKIQDILQTEFGFSDGGAPELMIYDNVWLTTKSYKYIKLARELTKLEAKNYYKMCLEKDKTISQLKAQIEHYKQLLQP